jgi:translation elongation factor EF-1alpha
VCRAADLALPFRFMVDQVLRVAGVGTVVCGVVMSGRARVADAVVFGAASTRCSIRSMQRFHTQVTDCQAGDMVGISLGDAKEVKKGDVLGLASAPPMYASSLTLEVRHVGHDIKVGFRPLLVLGTTKVTARLTAVAASLDEAGKVVSGSSGTTMTARTSYLVQLALPHAMPVEQFASFPRLGRCILMDGNSSIVAIGKVVAGTRAPR